MQQQVQQYRGIAPAPQQPDALTLAQAPAPQSDSDRKQRMATAWKSYRGEFQHPLKVKRDQPDDNILSNRCGPIVDKGVSFLFGQVLKVACVNQDGTPDDDATTYLSEALGDDDDKMTMLSKIAMNGGVCGNVFVKIIPKQRAMQYPRIVILDPQIVRKVTLPDDHECVMAYVLEYPTFNDWQKRQIIARIDPNSDLDTVGENDMADSWVVADYYRKGSYGSWIQKGEPNPWPYPFPPVLECQNLPNPNESWGTPDLTPDLIGMNKAIIFVLSNLNRILKYHGHPKTWAKGVNASQIQVAVDDVLVLQSPDAQIGNLEMTSNLADFLSLLADLRSDMDEQSRVPAVALGRLVDLPKGNISGVALQLLFQPLLEKTEQKRRLYGKLIREICRVLLVLSGILTVEQYATYRIQITWQNLLPIDDLAAAQTAQILQSLGVSDETLMGQLGYDADSETEKSTDEDQKKLTAFSRGQGLPPAVPTSIPLPQSLPGAKPLPGQPPAQDAPSPASGGQA